MNHCVVAALDAATVAKEMLVENQGIGADLLPTVYAFDAGGEMIGWTVLTRRKPLPGSENHPSVDMFGKLRFAIGVMRQIWAATDVVVIFEGYVGATEDPEAKRESLARAFAGGDQSVNECLILFHCSHEQARNVDLLPYRLKLGRKVEWLYDLRIKDNGAIPNHHGNLLAEMMNRSVHPDKFNMREAMIAASAINLDGAGFDTCILLDHLRGMK